MDNVLSKMSVEEQESWFLSQLEKGDRPVKDLIRFLDEARKKGQVAKADSWAEMLQEALLERKAKMEGLLLLIVRAHWGWKDPGLIRETLIRMVGDSREDRIMIDHVGFDRSIPPAECLRRLQLLFTLKPETLVYDKTWGAGVLRKLDPFYARVEIDFDSKPHHQMSLAYAAETLAVLADDHLLALKHRKPDELKAMIEENPAEVVRITLRSFGALSAPLLQERLAASGLVEESQWKRFWDAARKVLKKDGLVEIPAKRTEPIRLLAKEKSIDDGWFGALVAERDMETILTRVEALLENSAALEALTEASRAVLKDRLAFVIKGAGRRQSALLIRAVMQAAELKIDGDGVQVGAHAEMCFTDDEFLFGVLRNLPGRMIRPLFLFLCSIDKERAMGRLLALAPRFEMGALSDAIAILLENGRESDCAALFRAGVLAQNAEVEMLLWIARNTDRIESWKLGGVPLLSEMMLREMEKDYTGERLKAKNQLRDRYEQKEWLKATFEPLRDVKRVELMEKIKDSPAWSSMDRQSVMAKVIKQFPELQSVLAAKPKSSDGPAKNPVTSIRMYRERQAQLEKIVNVEIPRIAREIGVARSHGDLRENFEYKAAKEMQSFLLRRRSELEKMLQEVRPTNFQGTFQEKAGVATGVHLAYADGRKEHYFILGEWDQDDRLRIISSESKLAKALEGRGVGDEVSAPTEMGEAVARIEKIVELPPEIRAWIEGA